MVIGTIRLEYSEPWRFRLAREFEDKEPEHAREPFSFLEIIEFCEVIYPVLPSIRCLASRVPSAKYSSIKPYSD
jgi:hypothetical protein